MSVARGLTAEGCRSRRERLWQALAATGGPALAAVVLAQPEHLNYLAGFRIEPFSFRSAEAAALLVLTPDRAVIVTDNLVAPHAEAAYVDTVVAPVWYEAVQPAGPRRLALAQAAATSIARLVGSGLVACDAATPQAALAGIAARARSAPPIDPILAGLRRCKDPDELALLRRSIAAIEAGQAAAFEAVAPGRTELEVFQAIEQACVQALGERALIYGDFVCGPRSQGALGPPGTVRIARGELYILDFSVIVAGYRGDFANTLVVGGSATSEQSELMAGCRAALDAGEALLRPGADCRAIDSAMRQVLREAGLKPEDPSHLGHGIGLGHPEVPFIVRQGTEQLIEGDVVTLEPGQYGFPFGGLRIERNYLITASGCERLSGHRIALA